MNFIDLFSGAGGLSEGFIKTGYKPIAHVEIDKHACTTLETRLIYHKLKSSNKLNVYNDYLLGKMSRNDFISKYGCDEISNSIINMAIGGKSNSIIFDKIDGILKDKTVDIIIGGPPCQAYSLIGRSRDVNRMKNDSRNYLYKDYAKFLIKYKPKVFVFENVLGLLSAQKGLYFKNMKESFRSIGYNLDYKVQHSENFGVLQKRRRIILIGWRKDIDFSYPDFKITDIKFKVQDLLSDLKPLKPGELNNVTKYVKKTNKYLDLFKLRNGNNFVTQHIARPHNKRDLEIYEIAINKWKNNTSLKYPDLPARLKTHKNEKSFLDRFKVVNSNGLSHTMVAHISKDGHYYIYPDTQQVRSLSVREAARIQSFPDDYFFEGGRTSAFKQIGNAVPPLMSKEIAEAIKTNLNGKRKRKQLTETG